MKKPTFEDKPVSKAITFTNHKQTAFEMNFSKANFSHSCLLLMRVLVLWSGLAEQKPESMHSHKQVQSESWCESEYISSSDVRLSLTGSQPKLLVISISIIGCPSPC